jgi:hypothetical protein
MARRGRNMQWVRRKIKGELTYWNFVAIDGIIRNQLVLDLMTAEFMENKKLPLPNRDTIPTSGRGGWGNSHKASVMTVGVRPTLELDTSSVQVHSVSCWVRVTRMTVASGSIADVYSRLMNWYTKLPPKSGILETSANGKQLKLHRQELDEEENERLTRC